MRASVVLRLVSVVILLVSGGVAWGVPTLQLYLPGGTYVTSGDINGVSVTESWVETANPFELVVAGARSPAWATSIVNVRLWVGVQKDDYEAHSLGSLTITGAGGTLTPVSPVVYGIPEALDPHGVYPAYYYEYALPDLDVRAGEIVYDYDADFDALNPGASDQGSGQHQSYTVAYSDYSWLHFDLTGTVVGGRHSQSVVAPFSHDADGTPDDETLPPPDAVIPEPASVLLLAMGLAGLGLKQVRKRS